MCGELWILEHHLLAIRPQMFRVEIVRLRLAVVSIEAIKALIERIARAADRPEPPLADATQRVSELFQRQRQGQFTWRHRLLPFMIFAEAAPILANIRVALVLAAQECAARRRAHIPSGVMRHQLHPARRQSIEIRRANLLLAESPDVSVAQVVREDEDNVWLGCLSRRDNRPSHRGDQESDEAGEAHGKSAFKLSRGSAVAEPTGTRTSGAKQLRP